MNNPAVSFVVVCGHSAEYAREAIASILGQDKYDDFEIVILDAHERVIEADWLRRDPRIRLEETAGDAGMSTLERGLRQARGKYVAWSDSHDRYRPGFLRTLVPILERHTDVVLAYGDVAAINAKGEVQCKALDRRHEKRDFHGNEWLALLEENFIRGVAAIARREAWLQVLPIPQDTALVDWYLLTAIARRHDFYYCDEVVAEYRMRPIDHQALLDGREERQLTGYLEKLLSEREELPEMEHAKRAAQRRIWARHYRTLADKYLSAGQVEAARRCSWQAIRRGHQLSLTGLRHLAAAYLKPKHPAGLQGRPA
jgi:glycosyltransferase involved in cell wall biosynthesis